MKISPQLGKVLIFRDTHTQNLPIIYRIVVRLSVVLKNISAHWKNSKDDRVEEQEATEGEGEKTEVEPSLREFTLTLSR